MIDFQTISSAALSSAETLVTRWLPAGRKNGHEWLCGDLHGNAGESTSINLRTGMWADFAGDKKGGDLIALLAAIKECSQLDAAKEIAETLGIQIEHPPAAAPKSKKQQWTQVVPAPAHVAPPTMRHFNYGEAEGRWHYQDADGRTIGWIGRFAKSEGGKEVMPMSWGRNTETQEEKWCWLSFPKPRPLYGLPLLAEKPDVRVFIVEGEKCADAFRQFGALTITWPGGGKAVKHADWTPIKGRKVTIWPDADEPGHKAAQDIAETLHALGCEIRMITPPEGKAEGWDVADAVAEGWTKHQLTDLIKTATAYEPPKPKPEPKPLSEAVSDPKDQPYDLLGQDMGSFFYLSHGSRQIVSLTARQHAKNDLLQLAPLKHWTERYPGTEQSGGVNWLFAANSLIQESMRKGIFDPTLIRGRGAWLDEGRVVFHAGDVLHVDGTRVQIEKFKSRHIYQRGRQIDLPQIEPATDRQAYQLITLLKGTNLRHQMDPLLLAGWLVCAPICGALDWRPGIWISGKAGSGKTWLIEKVIQRMMGDAAVIANGTSTSEPGIRQTLRYDAFPVVIDEAETENKTDQERIQRILMLQRQASRESRARILKGSAGGEAMDFTIRSMFLWSSIGVAAIQRADLSRNVTMELVPGRHAHNPDQWQDLQDFQRTTAGDPKWCAAIRARALNMAPIIADNATTFATACVPHLGAQRDGDQIGTLLAGAYALMKGDRISLEEAQKWCGAQDWTAFKSSDTDMDEHRAFSIFMHAIIMHEEHGHVHRFSIAELIKLALNTRNNDRELAKATLARHGVAVRRAGGIDISDNHQELKRIFSDTPFAGKWADQLRRIKGAETIKNSHFHGVQSRATRLAFEIFVQPDEE